MANPISALAQYFTGPMVAHHSIGLQMGGHSGIAANAFFEARNALDISGYATAEEAEQLIMRACAPSAG